MFLCLLFLAGTTPANAITIDFEGNQFSDGAEIAGGIRIGTCNKLTLIMPRGNPVIAAVGAPMTSFRVNDGENSDVESVAGQYFLSNKNATYSGVAYAMRFDRPVRWLGMHLYDFRGDSTPPPKDIGNTATLRVYSDSGEGTSVGSRLIGESSYVVTGNEPDGNVVWLEVKPRLAPGMKRIRSASITFTGTDAGTGIDNISFSQKPCPTMPFESPSLELNDLCGTGSATCGEGMVCGKPCDEFIGAGECKFKIPFTDICIWRGKQTEYNLHALEWRCMQPDLACEVFNSTSQ